MIWLSAGCASPHWIAPPPQAYGQHYLDARVITATMTRTKVERMEAGERAQQLRVLTMLPENVFKSQHPHGSSTLTLTHTYMHIDEHLNKKKKKKAKNWIMNGLKVWLLSTLLSSKSVLYIFMVLSICSWSFWLVGCRYLF